MDIGRQRLLIGSLIVLFLVLAFVTASQVNKRLPEVRLGYAHGGRATILYRGYIHDEFEKEKVNVKLFTQNFQESNLQVVPKNVEEIKEIDFYGKVSGEELLSYVLAGSLDGAFAGPSAFIDAVTKGTPLVAVAMLGYETKDKPEHAIIFRKDVVINKTDDIKGKTLVSARGGFGLPVFLYEFLESIGLDPKNDVKILYNVNEDEMIRLLQENEADGGYYPLLLAESLVKNGHAYVYRTLDWLNPELSYGLLVFDRDFIEGNPEAIQRILTAYMKRIAYEQSLSQEERLKDPGEGLRRGLQIERDFMGMNVSQHKYPPFVPLELLREMQGLLLKWGYIDTSVNLEDFMDNSFVQAVYEELK